MQLEKRKILFVREKKKKITLDWRGGRISRGSSKLLKIHVAVVRRVFRLRHHNVGRGCVSGETWPQSPRNTAEEAVSFHGKKVTGPCPGL